MYKICTVTVRDPSDIGQCESSERGRRAREGCEAEQELEEEESRCGKAEGGEEEDGRQTRRRQEGETLRRRLQEAGPRLCRKCWSRWCDPGSKEIWCIAPFDQQLEEEAWPEGRQRFSGWQRRFIAKGQLKTSKPGSNHRQVG